jgi:hypothetical protein
MESDDGEGVLPAALTPPPQSTRLHATSIIPSSLCTCVRRNSFLSRSPSPSRLRCNSQHVSAPSTIHPTRRSIRSALPEVRKRAQRKTQAGSKVTMLLPSAFPCECAMTQMRPQRPKRVSMSSYQPQTQTQPQAQVAQARAGLIASCRALHSMLGASLSSPQLLLRTPKKELRNPFEASFAVSGQLSRTPPHPRGANKRGRDTFEDCKENSSPENQKTYSTPKRQRRIPLAMPLGLSAADFQALEMPSLSSSPAISLPDPCSPPQSSDDHDSGYGPSPSLSEDGMEWSVDDDRVLVETVLEKLQLSKRAWNDCARALGKDKDSLGRRWRSLVDDGHVGLKRGGRMRRTGLEIDSW